jgi:hypothetical protein
MRLTFFDMSKLTRFDCLVAADVLHAGGGVWLIP